MWRQQRMGTVTTAVAVHGTRGLTSNEVSDLVIGAAADMNVRSELRQEHEEGGTR
ncbi:hypothetical protein [Streptomyces sp. NPDC058486]|uniref:hypothetical protein n=1 Tax=unclassified Streptomyces TaxID=2593676 RepID=UPI00366A14C4